MHCIKNIKNDLIWIGGNDRRLSLFEGVYSVPNGVSYNSYLLKDEKIVIFDTVDKAVSEIFFENLEYTLDGKTPDYIIVQHMEPDHSATLKQLLCFYPNITIVCNEKIKTMINQFFDFKAQVNYLLVKEGDTLTTGKHVLTFVMAPMVHWPEVMVTYDLTDKILFSADAFGTFGALNGAIFADEVNFERDYLDEARRYYCNIVGKYGPQVQMLLKKASNLEIDYICPLHGFVWRQNLNFYIDKYLKWSSYTPEENGVMIAYASIYGHTAITAEIISSKLRENGIKTVMFDVSVTPVSEIVAAAFRWSHLIFASATYNAGIFISMEDLLRDLAAHNIQKRTVGFVENGSWAATSGKLMKEIFEKCKDISFIENTVSFKSSLKNEQLENLDKFVEEITLSFKNKDEQNENEEINSNVFKNISYGLYLLTTKDGEKDNGCIVNTVQMLTDSPKRISVTVSKQNYSHELIQRTKKLNISILDRNINFNFFERFGFKDGKSFNKFENKDGFKRSSNEIFYYENSCGYISGDVENTIDLGTHSLFVIKVKSAEKLLNQIPLTYEYYHSHIKPQPIVPEENKNGFLCKICGYFYEGETIPDDFICPLCKHGVSDFIRIHK